ncbi:MAG: sulfite exporter TauE/SafE family protein [Niameybacter sp.]
MKTFIFLIIVLLTNIIQGITGFAGTVLAMPFTILLLGIEVAKPLLNIVTLVACVLIVFESYKEIVWKEFLKMTAIMLVGVFIGEYIYALFPVDVLLIIYAIFIILIALKGIFVRKEYEVTDAVLIGVIVLSGIVHGMFLSGGPLLIIYAVKKLPKKAFRATLAPVWIVLNSYLLVKQFMGGFITTQIMVLSLISVPILIVAVIVGKKLYEHMSQKTFLMLSYMLLLISGISLIL